MSDTVVRERAKQFYDFMGARERIRLAREAGEPRERWTNDPILREYKFTNVKRWHDRTTRVLREEFYEPHHDRPAAQVFLNCVLYRYFGTVEFARAIGWSEAWSAKRRDRVLRTAAQRLEQGLKVFTGAYIVPNCGSSKPKHEVVCGIVDGIKKAGWFNNFGCVRDWSWQRAVEAFTDCRGVGSFMAKEVFLDYIMATGAYPDDWKTWTPVGPGARRGAARVLLGDLSKTPHGVREDLALEVCVQLYAMRSEFWGAPGAVLDLTDIQFQLCEFDKYERVRLGEGRPKAKFSPHVGE